MEGLPLAGFRLLTFGPQGFEPVPFQIDEVDEDGLYVLTDGPEPNRDEGGKGKRRNLDGSLDGNDELVFMASDCGDRADLEAWPAGAGRLVEIEVRDPVTAGQGWTYLAWFSDPPPESPRDYVRYDPQEDRIYADCYTLGYAPEKDLVYTTSLAIRPECGGNGRDLLDRLLIRFSATVLLRGVTFSRNEDDFVSRVLAYKDGPVRMMRRVANSMRLVVGLRTPKLIAYSMYYRDAVEAPNRIDIPVAVGAVLKDFHFEGGADYLSEAVGMRFSSSRNPEGVPVDGHMSPKEEALDPRDLEWTLLAGPQGNLLTRIDFGPGLRGVVGKELVYRDDAARSEPPESEPGQFPKIAFSFTNLTALKRGRYSYSVHFYCLPSYSPGSVKEFLDILDRPLEVKPSERQPPESS